RATSLRERAAGASPRLRISGAIPRDVILDARSGFFGCSACSVPPESFSYAVSAAAKDESTPGQSRPPWPSGGLGRTKSTGPARRSDPTKRPALTLAITEDFPPA